MIPGTARECAAQEARPPRPKSAWSRRPLPARSCPSSQSSSTREGTRVSRGRFRIFMSCNLSRGDAQLGHRLTRRSTHQVRRRRRLPPGAPGLARPPPCLTLSCCTLWRRNHVVHSRAIVTLSAARPYRRPRQATPLARSAREGPRRPRARPGGDGSRSPAHSAHEDHAERSRSYCCLCPGQRLGIGNADDRPTTRAPSEQGRPPGRRTAPRDDARERKPRVLHCSPS